jgi:hypothetical protein
MLEIRLLLLQPFTNGTSTVLWIDNLPSVPSVTNYWVNDQEVSSKTTATTYIHLALSCYRITPHDRAFDWGVEVELGKLLTPQK